MNGNSVLEEAYAVILSQVDRKKLTALIKANHHAAGQIFTGFRTAPSSLEQEPVRKRVVRKALECEEFALVVLALWADGHPEAAKRIAGLTSDRIKCSISELANELGGAALWASLGADNRKTVRKMQRLIDQDLLRVQPAGEKSADGASGNTRPSDNEKLHKAASELAEARAKLDKSHAEIHALRKSLANAEKSLAAAKSREEKLKLERARLTQECDECRKNAAKIVKERDKLAARLADKETAVGDRDETIRELRKALDAKPGGRPASRAISQGDWDAALIRLVESGRQKAAIALLEELLKNDAENPRVRNLLARAYLKDGQAECALSELAWLAEHYLAKKDYPRVVRCACSVLSRVPDHGRAKELLWEVIKRTHIHDEVRKSVVRKALRELRTGSPRTFAEISQRLRRELPLLASDLEEPASPVSPDTQYEFSAGRQVKVMSVRDITRAIDRNDLKTVSFLRSALRQMKKPDPDSHAQIVTAANQLGDGYAAVLTSFQKIKPVVVDGSNVAHCAPARDGRARLENIRHIRAELRLHGYYPIYVYADAALRHQIDHPSDFDTMVEAGDIELAQPKADADGEILSRARRESCPIVTNDAMRDWDPESKVPKIRFRANSASVELLD